MTQTKMLERRQDGDEDDVASVAPYLGFVY